MAKQRKRPMTDPERVELDGLCRKAKRGSLNIGEQDRAQSLFDMDPKGYSEVSAKASADVVREERERWSVG